MVRFFTSIEAHCKAQKYFFLRSELCVERSSVSFSCKFDQNQCTFSAQSMHFRIQKLSLFIQKNEPILNVERPFVSCEIRLRCAISHTRNHISHAELAHCWTQYASQRRGRPCWLIKLGFTRRLIYKRIKVAKRNRSNLYFGMYKSWFLMLKLKENTSKHRRIK